MRLRIWLLVFLGLIPFVSEAQSAAMKTPNISADTLFLYRNSNFDGQNASTTRNGLDIQEAEVVFYTDVDPYSWVNMVLSVHPTYTVDPTTQKVTESWELEPEELYAESEYFRNITLRLGKFKADFGKHNLLHTHVFPFVDAPMINRRLLGEEGLNDVGLSAAYLLPTNWYSDITAQYLRGAGDNTEFNSQTPNDAVGLVHWKNLTDLTDSTTMEIGASYAGGPNDYGGNTNLTGADLTFKWRPEVGGLYHSAILASEYIRRDMGASQSADESSWGLSNWFAYQWAERWTGRVRYETLSVNHSLTATDTDGLANGNYEGGSIDVDFQPTEFSYFRLEYDVNHGPEENWHLGKTNESKIYLQANFVIGSHPAHSY